MARYYKYLRSRFVALPLCLLTFLLFSCQEGGEAGDLHGMWRMNGSDRHYICFSGTLVTFRKGNGSDVFGKFQREGDSLFIQCYSVKGSVNDTLLIEEHFGMQPFSNIRLKVEALNSDQLLLQKGSRLWSFYPY